MYSEHSVSLSTGYSNLRAWRIVDRRSNIFELIDMSTLRLFFYFNILSEDTMPCVKPYFLYGVFTSVLLFSLTVGAFNCVPHRDVGC